MRFGPGPAAAFVLVVALAMAGVSLADQRLTDQRLADPSPTMLATPTAQGDADSDTYLERAVVVEQEVGRALARVYVAVFEDSALGWRLVAAVQLADGAVVDRLRLAPGYLTVTFRRHYPIDPPCCPSRTHVRSFAMPARALVGGPNSVRAGDASRVHNGDRVAGGGAAGVSLRDAQLGGEPAWAAAVAASISP